MLRNLNVIFISCIIQFHPLQLSAPSRIALREVERLLISENQYTCPFTALSKAPGPTSMQAHCHGASPISTGWNWPPQTLASSVDKIRPLYLFILHRQRPESALKVIVCLPLKRQTDTEGAPVVLCDWPLPAWRTLCIGVWSPRPAARPEAASGALGISHHQH